MEEKLIRIFQLFVRYGIKSMTMDKIASHLSISKKTLYVLADNKAELVNKVLLYYLQKEQKAAKTIARESDNAIESMIHIAQFIGSHIQDLNSNAIYDLQKYYPQAWALMEEHRSGFVYKQIVNNIKSGIKEELYKKDLIPDVIAQLYIALSMSLHNHDLNKNTNLNILYSEMIKYHLNAIVSPKGAAIIKIKKLFSTFNSSKS